MRKLFNLTLAAAVLYALTSLLHGCSEEADCSMTNNRGMIVCNLYHLDPATGVAQKGTLDSLTVTAAGTDSVIINRMNEVKNFSLPLRYTEDSTQFVFHYTGRLTDTVIVRHTNKPYFVSMDCGYQMQQNITSVRYTRRNLDSIYIANPEASIDGTENLKLFY